MNIISYLTYAGGFDVGMANAGLKPTYHIHDGYAQDTYAMNWPDIESHHHRGRCKLDFVDVLFANPPCACWSVNGKQLGLKDPRIADTLRLVSLAEEYDPKVLITESVLQARPFFVEFAQRFHALGYATMSVLHNAKWCGMIQDRRRMFFIAHKIGVDIPAPNWAPPRPSRDLLESSHLLSEDRAATRPLERGSFDGIIDQIKPGESLARAWERLIGGPDESAWPRNERGGVKGRPPFCSYRLHPDKPTRAFTGYYAYVHPTQDRWLTLREIKEKLCEFPADYKFKDQHIGEQMKEMSRGVMPPVAAWLGRHIKASLNNPSVDDICHQTLDYLKSPQ